MKIFVYLSASISAIRNPDLKLDYQPKCNSCVGSSYADCLANVWEEFCRDDKVCQVQERRRGGRVYSVESGCKEVMTCVNNRENNKKEHGSDALTECTQETQDHNKAEIGSVCRQCMHPDGTSGTDFKQIVDATGDTGLTLAKWMEETLDYSIYGEATMRKIGDGLK
ncbi:unnamed protein product [Oikopleura dioica]|uniref:Uncharacterized protein n=1 Tax=Oikopleura dioica TaxID=34765 RepID=E4XEV5_OIKDI|nr:unnamed protein product [Oikopleura dioica]